MIPNFKFFFGFSVSGGYKVYNIELFLATLLLLHFLKLLFCEIRRGKWLSLTRRGSKVDFSISGAIIR